jgi:hypothetical protein
MKAYREGQADLRRYRRAIARARNACVRVAGSDNTLLC